MRLITWVAATLLAVMFLFVAGIMSGCSDSSPVVAISNPGYTIELFRWNGESWVPVTPDYQLTVGEEVHADLDYSRGGIDFKITFTFPDGTERIEEKGGIVLTQLGQYRATADIVGDPRPAWLEFEVIEGLGLSGQ